MSESFDELHDNITDLEIELEHSQQETSDLLAENVKFQDRIKELEQKLSIYEWKPASEAVLGREYDVAGGKWQDFSQYADYETWYDMKNHVAVATCEDIEDVFPNFKGAYSDEYGAQYFYQPEWIRERPTPPSTQEGEE